LGNAQGRAPRSTPGVPSGTAMAVGLVDAIVSSLRLGICQTRHPPGRSAGAASSWFQAPIRRPRGEVMSRRVSVTTA
jgi:hypothetical protein